MYEETAQIRERSFKRLEELSEKLIAIYSLKFSRKVGYLADPLHRWMDFRMRYINPEPRDVFVSNKFPEYLPGSVKHGLRILTRRIQDGADINMYQSKGIIKFNDVSSSNRATN